MPSTEHESLKYHLLGPSLTKAGQDAVDQHKISEIIYNMSKGSKFFKHEETRDKNLTEKIDKLLSKRCELDMLDLSHDLRKADHYIKELELKQDLSQVIVHIDCDAFFATVEELDQPELQDVPMAVGKGVLTTCNYHARRFGCRSGMAEFVAKKLCPQLVCLPIQFEKYSAKAEEVRHVLAEYDAYFESASCDEAYLNLTQYCKKHELTPEDAVGQLRADVYARTSITVSAGIAANANLSKICSNRNKPNGQFRLPNEREAIKEFTNSLPMRRVNGIGRVFERELAVLGVRTCGDIYVHRAQLLRLFGQKKFQFLMQCYVGFGRTLLKPTKDYKPKSVGTETTFKELGTPEGLREKLRHAAEELERDLKCSQYKGRTLCLKAKLHTFQVVARQVTLPFAIELADDLYQYSLPLLERLMHEFPNTKFRLIGLRLTHIVSTKNSGIDFFNPPGTKVDMMKSATRKSESEWEAWSEEQLKNPAQQKCNDSTIDPNISSQEERQEGDGGTKEHQLLPHEEQMTWFCPVCSVPKPPDDASFNSHLDSCLSRNTIKRVIQEIEQSGAASQSRTLPSIRKRHRLQDKASSLEREARR